MWWCHFYKEIELHSHRMVLKDMGPADRSLGHWLFLETLCALLVSDAISCTALSCLGQCVHQNEEACVYTSRCIHPAITDFYALVIPSWCQEQPSLLLVLKDSANFRSSHIPSELVPNRQIP